MTRRFFNSETGIWRFFGWVGDIVILSLLWTLFSLPLLTAGASSTALYDAAVHSVRRREDSAFERFWRTFRREWKTATLSALFWAAIAAVPVLLYMLTVRSAPEGQPITLQSVLFLLLLFLLLCILSWVFPLLSRFTFSFISLQGTAVRLALGQILRSSAMALLSGLGIWACLNHVFSVFFAPGLIAWLSTFLIEPVFQSYENPPA